MQSWINESLNLTINETAKQAANVYGYLFVYFFGFLSFSILYLVFIREDLFNNLYGMEACAMATAMFFCLFLFGSIKYHINILLDLSMYILFTCLLYYILV